MLDIKEHCQAALVHIVNYYRCVSENDGLQLEIATLPESTTLKALALDDLDLMDLICRIEDQLQIQLDDSVLTLESSLNALFNAVQDALRRKQAA